MKTKDLVKELGCKELLSIGAFKLPEGALEEPSNGWQCDGERVGGSN